MSRVGKMPIAVPQGVDVSITAEGEATAHAIAEALRARGVRSTRLARGVPIGSELEYVDLSLGMRSSSKDSRRRVQEWSVWRREHLTVVDQTRPEELIESNGRDPHEHSTTAILKSSIQLF